MFLWAEVEGEEELKRVWGQTYGTLKSGARTAVSKAVKEGANEARTKHTFTSRTGKLEKGIEGFAVGWVNDETYAGWITVKPRYGQYVEYGTKPHMIVGNPFLHFQWKGEWVNFRYVNHPGTKAQPFMHLAYYKAERVLQREMEIAVEKAQKVLDR